MAYDRELACRLTDRLMAEANRELSDLIVAQKLELSCEKYDHVVHPLQVVALDISSRLRGPFTDKNVIDRMSYDCEFWACVHVEGSRYHDPIYLSVPCFLDRYLLHALDGIGGVLIIEPSAPDDFSKLLRALRTQLQTGEGVKAPAPPPPRATPQPSGCFAMIAGTLVRRVVASLR